MKNLVSDDALATLLCQPQNAQEIGVPQSLVIDILLRLLYNEGNVNFGRMSQVMRLPMIVEPLLEWMRQERMLEVIQSSAALGPFNYIYKLTDIGLARAHEALERSQYVGPVPVSVDQYCRAIEMQTIGPRKVDAREMQEALSDMILPANFHRSVGPAVNSAASLFLYGPSGNGKTTIAQRIARLIAGMEPIWLPYAISAGGQIIQIHDRLFHTYAEGKQKKTMDRVDGRWALFQRPSVIVGGELKMDALDLRFDPVAKIYEAPLQLKANGGMFIIDDFGRQQITPGDLLNRWIVPLENGVDYLRLGTGQTIVVPFRAFIVFSTNLNPYDLADDAFYRRIQMKVGVFSPDETLFRQIFLKTCGMMDVAFDEVSYTHLLEKWYKQQGRQFQAVHPRDIVKNVQSLCMYEGTVPAMTPDRVDEACASYFVKEN
ncbi:MAG: ATPase AAA [Chloroflexi bacterium]|nr:MAG: ATPase AAA [Chloroflexota bacterium]MBA4376570.1 AAA family ATPase [Anaerolinea sp.]